MDKDLEFIETERSYWGKIYTEIMFALNEISPFVDDKKLKQRKYYSKSDTLKEYTKLLDSAETDCKKKSLFSIFKSNPTISLLQDYKAKNRDDFTQLEKCYKCECLSCSFECNFKSCSACRSNSLLSFCDKDRVNIRKFDNFTFDLTNNDTGISSKYKVLAVIEDCIINKEYILLENLRDSNDKLVLYYYPGIKEDTFGEITDVKEFDFIVETYQNA